MLLSSCTTCYQVASWHESPQQALPLHEVLSYSLTRNELVLQVLAVAEQAFLAFLENADEAFSIMTKHAARRRAMHQQAIRNNSTTGNNITAANGQAVRSPPLVFTAAHMEFMDKLACLMSRLPGGNAGQPLFAIAASIKSRMTVQ